MSIRSSQLSTTKTTVTGHSVPYETSGCVIAGPLALYLQPVDELDSPKPKLVPIAEGVWLTWRESVLIDVREIGTVQILDEDLGTLNKDTGMLP